MDILSWIIFIVISLLTVVPFIIRRLVVFIVSQVLSKSGPFEFDIRSIGIINFSGVTVRIPNEVTLSIKRVTIGSSLVSSKYHSNLVVILEGVDVNIEREFGGELLESPADDVLSNDLVNHTTSKTWLQDLLQIVKSKTLFDDFTWSIDAKDLSITTNQFKLSISKATAEFKLKEYQIIINDALVESQNPLTIDDINSQAGVHTCLAISHIQFCLNKELNEHRYVLRNQIYIQWTPLLHLTVINILRSQLPIWRKILGRRPSVSDNRSNLAPNKLVHVDLQGDISVGALLSNEGQYLVFTSSSCSIVIPTKGRFSLKSDSIRFICDGHKICKFDRPSLLLVPENEGATIINREEFVGANFVMKKNRALKISIERTRITFPYKYDFADTFNDRFIGVTKWLRRLHRKQSSVESVGMDIVIESNHIVMEIEDDPFEVKLRNNYELLEDELQESITRKQKFDETIERLRMTMPVTDKLVNKMIQDLERKKHEIYIKRHKQLYETSHRKYNLFTVQCDRLKIKIAADRSITGHEKLVRIMRQDLDPLSPFPEDLRFSTIWCRQVIGRIDFLACKLRNFPQNMMDMNKVVITGRVMGAEQQAPLRARRKTFVDLSPNIDSLTVERTMPSLKIYHDIKFRLDTLNYCHGAAWDPVLTQLSLCFENIIKPSRDPSPGLSWWDKMRLLFHGRLIIEGKNMSMLFHGSLDPYNSTEMLEIAFSKSIIDWLTGRVVIRGSVDFLVHTASKYDECRIIHLPNIDATIYLNWECIGSQYDHHSAIPCAPDKLPEYSSHQQHDSYRAFRSHALNIKLSLESKETVDIPSVLLYSNSMRWFENQKQIISGIARLTRRGKLFGNTRPRKPQFSRILKRIQVAICLSKFKATYWSSANKTYGCEFLGENLSHSAEHFQTLVPFDDGYHRRPRPVWSMAYMNSEITNVEIWLYNNRMSSSAEEEKSRKNRMYLLSISRVSYNRENQDVRSPECENKEDIPPTHRLIVHDLKGAWTIVNKEVVFALYDMFMKSQMLKRNLSTEALKGLKVEAQAMPTGVSPFKIQESLGGSKTSLNKNYAASMLKKLIAESESNPNIVYSEDVESELMITDEVRLKGLSACQDDDIIHRNWLIELINSQVVLRGCETSGYVIASASKCQIWQRIHKPVWKERTLLSKETWVGSVDCMQYYATVDAKIDSDVVWLPVDDIQQKDNMKMITDLTDLVGSGQRVGGVVSLTVGSDAEHPTDPEEEGAIEGTGATIQLQRIISRCSCKFYFCSFTEDIDTDIIKEIPPIPDDDDLIEPWDKEVAVDSFTMMHNELDVSTNSQQFAMIIDLINNLLLYVEPHRKEAVEKMQSMRFQFQLSTLEEQREPISLLQDHLRRLIAELKQSERECYRIQRQMEEMSEDPRLQRELDIERDKAERLKAEIGEKGDDLAMRISCFKEAQLMADRDRERQEAMASGKFVSSVIKRIEVCFKQASWVLTDADGQLQLADVTLRNFLYTKVAKNDDCFEHSLELGFIQVLNRLPNQAYTTVLEPTDLGENIPLDRRHTLRVFCRERPPVAGISVKEHFEVNVIPLTIAVTKAFFKRMLKFFWPEPEEERHERRMLRRKRIKKQEDNASETSSTSSAPTVSTTSRQSEKSLLAVTRHANVTDVDKMRERAQKNQTFVYIKIPEVPVKVSYRGGKSHHISSIDNFTLILPTIEYHNQTWTWLDVLMAVKNESQKRLLPQAVKQKLTIWPTKSSESSAKKEKVEEVCKGSEEDQERKARLLLGNHASPTPSTRTNRLSSFFKK